MTTPSPDIEQHPDVATMRHRYDEISETPVAQSADGLSFLSGLFLAMSPWVIGFTDQSAITVTNLFTGIAIALLAVGFVAAYGHMHGMAWVAPLLGAWAIVAPWVVSGPTPENAALVSNVIVGALALLCAVAMMSTGMRRRGTR
ncbi:SPW repeat-containing protein [Haloactinopolyspora alba]|uniref:SPW repeat-containing protein n=1 Tax=Haloactinopolyspora alba TaxID=648780 RepID=A0A2P8D178_9ACTN|nr:SPW repeat protein [Haloactinopolyspora alba]PSK90990.1 SPW repeat-containing protein [Haloactinopolyspora alba]